MNVRPAEPRDADAVLALMEGLTRPAVADDPEPQRDVFLAHLEHEDALVFVAELDGQIAGAVSLWIQPRLNWTTPQAWIPDLYVDPRVPAARRRPRSAGRLRRRGSQARLPRARPRVRTSSGGSPPALRVVRHLRAY